MKQKIWTNRCKCGECIPDEYNICDKCILRKYNLVGEPDSNDRLGMSYLRYTEPDMIDAIRNAEKSEKNSKIDQLWDELYSLDGDAPLGWNEKNNDLYATELYHSGWFSFTESELIELLEILIRGRKRRLL